MTHFVSGSEKQKMKIKYYKTAMAETINIPVMIIVEGADDSVEKSVSLFIHGFILYGARYVNQHGNNPHTYFFNKINDFSKRLRTREFELMDIIIKWVNIGTNKEILHGFTINSRPAIDRYELARSINEIDHIFD